jgi:hypothetical protein
VNREDEAGRKPEIFGRIDPLPDIFRIAAEAGEILAENDPLAARCADAVGVVISGGIADCRRQPRAQFLA